MFESSLEICSRKPHVEESPRAAMPPPELPMRTTDLDLPSSSFFMVYELYAEYRIWGGLELDAKLWSPWPSFQIVLGCLEAPNLHEP
jgi:hypothetical protein